MSLYSFGHVYLSFCCCFYFKIDGHKEKNDGVLFRSRGVVNLFNNIEFIRIKLDGMQNIHTFLVGQPNLLTRPRPRPRPRSFLQLLVVPFLILKLFTCIPCSSSPFLHEEVHTSLIKWYQPGTLHYMVLPTPLGITSIKPMIIHYYLSLSMKRLVSGEGCLVDDDPQKSW